MNQVTLNLTLSYKDAAAVLSFLDSNATNYQITTDLGVSDKSVTPTPVIIPKKEAGFPTPPVKDGEDGPVNIDIKPPVVKPTAGKKTKMPGFGRSQAQVDAYAEAEAARIEALDEEAEIKAQRAEERAARKAERDAIEQEKKTAADKAAKEVADIKANDKVTPTSSDVPKKPWEL